jgi:hypothetical protein
MKDLKKECDVEDDSYDTNERIQRAIYLGSRKGKSHLGQL